MLICYTSNQCTCFCSVLRHFSKNRSLFNALNVSITMILWLSNSPCKLRMLFLGPSPTYLQQWYVKSAFDEAGHDGFLRSRFLILGCSALSLQHSWKNLVQNMIDIFCTPLPHDFPLPELLYAIYQLLLFVWLDFRFQVELELMPQGVQLGWGHNSLEEYTTSQCFASQRRLVLAWTCVLCRYLA